MQIQMTENSGTIIKQDDVFIFDDIILELDPNITYNSASGEFTIHKPGNYAIHWWLNVDGAEGLSGTAQASILVDGELHSSSLSPVTTGQFSGHSLITVTTTPKVITLANTTSGAMRLSNLPMQGGFLIYS